MVVRTAGAPHTLRGGQGPGEGIMQGSAPGRRAENHRASSLRLLLGGWEVSPLRANEAPLPCTEPHRAGPPHAGAHVHWKCGVWRGRGAPSAPRSPTQPGTRSMSLHLPTQVQRHADGNLPEETDSRAPTKPGGRGEGGGGLSVAVGSPGIHPAPGPRPGLCVLRSTRDPVPWSRSGWKS